METMNNGQERSNSNYNFYTSNGWAGKNYDHNSPPTRTGTDSIPTYARITPRFLMWWLIAWTVVYGSSRIRRTRPKNGHPITTRNIVREGNEGRSRALNMK